MHTVTQPEIKLLDYWQVLRRRRWAAISFFVITVTTVTLGTFLMTPLYQATTNLIIEGENANVLNASESTGDAVNFNIFENYIETQIAVIKSEKIAGRVAEEFKLAESPRYRERKILGKSLQREFKDDVSVERVRDTRMVEISVFNPDAKLAADLANRLAEVYSQDNLMRRALTFIRNQRMGSLNAEFLRLQSKLDTMSNTYGPKHPDMIALKEEIRVMAQRIQNERLGAAAETGKTLSENQKLLEDTLLRIQESSVMSSSRMNNIGVVDTALVPEKPAKPRILLNLALGFFLGGLGGVLLAFFMDYMDDTVKTDEDVKKHVATSPFLGSLLSERSLKNGAPSNDRLVDKRPDSASAEAYRLIRTRLLWSMSKEKPLKDIAVLSSIPGEGKTTVASNLAIALTQLKMKILLVDSDLRRGRLHDVYGFANDKGLGQYLTDNLPLEQVIKKTDIDGLWLVTSGKSVIDSSQLFSSRRMEEFIKSTRERFDMVVYDTPPVTVIADPVILVSKLDGCILTARSGLTGMKVLPKALATIHESKANLMGVVLNDSNTGDNIAYSNYYNAYHRS